MSNAHKWTVGLCIVAVTLLVFCAVLLRAAISERDDLRRVAADYQRQSDELAEQLAEATRQLERAEAAIGQSIAEASELGSILGNLSTGFDEIDRIIEAIARDIDSIVGELQRLQSLSTEADT